MIEVMREKALINCISFDFDRTLAHVVPPTHHLFSKLLQEKGLAISPDLIAQKFIKFRQNLPMHLKKQLQKYGRLSHPDRRKFIREYNKARFHYLGLTGSTERLAEIQKEIIQQLFHQQKKILYDDVSDTIINLKKQGKKLFVLSGNHSDSISEILSSAGILDYFEEIITVDKYSLHKIDNFQQLLHKSSFSPREILHIGDDVVTDGHGPRKYNINSLLIYRDDQIIYHKITDDSFTIIQRLEDLYNYLD
ncbi:MAG: HAD hydrolase-like protein [Candidatus Heimdallarchaeota archaeon]|nr:HAD hydrolase-like protein [Candidatus Heimdallarchaeota archaeon]